MELNQPVIKEKMSNFDAFVLKKFGDSMGPAMPESDPTDPLSEYQHYEDDDGDISNLPEADDILDYDLNISILKFYSRRTANTCRQLE